MDSFESVYKRFFKFEIVSSNPIHVSIIFYKLFNKSFFLQAVELGYQFDLHVFQKNERMKFGGLLSNMFVNYWEKTMIGSRESTDEKILKLVLSWPPFTSFLQILSKYHRSR